VLISITLGYVKGHLMSMDSPLSRPAAGIDDETGHKRGPWIQSSEREPCRSWRMRLKLRAEMTCTECRLEWVMFLFISIIEGEYDVGREGEERLLQ
jgi:hypothetical protein